MFEKEEESFDHQGNCVKVKPLLPDELMLFTAGPSGTRGPRPSSAAARCNISSLEALQK